MKLARVAIGTSASVELQIHAGTAVESMFSIALFWIPVPRRAPLTLPEMIPRILRDGDAKQYPQH
jgi:hypothetical protein